MDTADAPPGGPRAAQSPALRGPRSFAILAALVLCVLLAALDQTLIAPALPTIVVELGGLAHLPWVVIAYLLGATVTLPLYGRLGEAYGRRAMLVVALLGVMAGATLCGAAQSMPMLIAGRVLQGLGAGGLIVGAHAIVTALSATYGGIGPRARHLAVLAAALGLGTVLGPVAGGYLTAESSWRWVFYVNIPLGALALALLSAAPPLSRSAAGRRHVDVLGPLLLGIAVTTAVVVAGWGTTSLGWTSPAVGVIAAMAGIATLAWLVSAVVVRDPAVPLRLLRAVTFDLAAIVSLGVGAAFFAALTFIPLFLQLVTDANALGVGLLLLPLVGGLAGAAIGAALLIRRSGRYKVYPLVGCGLAILATALLSTMDSDSGQLRVATCLLMLGVGIGLAAEVVVMAVRQQALPVDLSVSTMAMTFVRQFGGALGVALCGSVLAARLDEDLAMRMPAHAIGEALPQIFLAVAPLLGVAFIAALLLPHRPLPAAAGGGGAEPPAASGGPAVSSGQGSFGRGSSGTVSGSSGAAAGRAAAPPPAGPTGPTGPTGPDTPPAGRVRAQASVPMFPPVTIFPPTVYPPAFPAVPTQPGPPDSFASSDFPPTPYPPMPFPPVPFPTVPTQSVPEPTVNEAVMPEPEIPEPMPQPVVPEPRGPEPEEPTTGVVTPPPVVAPPPPPVAPAPPSPPAPPPAPPSPEPGAAQPVPPGHLIRGTVTTPAGSPVVGAVVTLLEPTGARAGVGHTDLAGAYHLVAPHEGSYLLVATAIGHQPHARTVRTNGNPRTDHIALAGSASVTGIVRTAGHRRPVPLATVTAVDPVGQVIAAVTADDEGRYDLANLPPGAHTIAAHAPAHRPAAILTNLDADQHAERDLDLPPAAAIDGTVRSRTGAPVADARVVLIAAGGEVAARTLTHANGTFRFDDLCDGTYTLVASAYAPTALSATIENGRSVGADIQLGHD